MNRLIPVLAMLMIIPLLSSCDTVSSWSEIFTTQEPVGIGIGTDEYKRSPCACVELKLLPPDPAYLRGLERRLATPV